MISADRIPVEAIRSLSSVCDLNLNLPSERLKVTAADAALHCESVEVFIQTAVSDQQGNADSRLRSFTQRLATPDIKVAAA